MRVICGAMIGLEKGMISDFFDAHHRHWEDAEFLHGDSRWANADHLYGMAAESGLKRLMQAFGMPVDAIGKPSDSKDRHHVDKIWARYESYRSGRGQGAYSLPGNPFVDWNVSQRYARRSEFDRARVEGHRRGSQIVRSLLSKAELEGLI